MTRTALDTLVARLHQYADGQRAAQLEVLGERLAAGRFRLLIVGEAKRGKSTLINALLGGDLLPTGVTPVTALTTTVRHGSPQRVEVVYADGRREQTGVDALAGLVTEAGNPGNRKHVTDVTVLLPATPWDEDVEVVDTPGVGSVFVHADRDAAAALDTMDAAVFLLSADPPISASETAFLQAVRGKSVALFCVLNKADNLGPHELDQVAGFTAGIVGDALARPLAVYAMSARRARHAQQSHDPAALAESGLPRLRADLDAYLRQHRSRDLVMSVAGHVRGNVAGYLQVLPPMPAAQLEDQARAYAIDQIRTTAEAWRAERLNAITQGLSELDSRLVTALMRHLDSVRDAARDLLGVDLTLPAPATRMLPDLQVHYDFRPDIGVTVEWADAIRRRLPGRWGRRAVTSHLLKELDMTVGKQFGRIRSALQDALRSVTTTLIKTVEARYTDSARGLFAALAAAQDLAASPDLRARLLHLDEQVEALTTAINELTGYAGPAASTSEEPPVAAQRP